MAFLQPPASQQPAFNIPGAVAVLLIVLIVAHVARMLVPAPLADDILVRYAFNPALYSPGFLTLHHLDPGPLWQRAVPFVSYMFLHGDLTHLAVNCVWLLAFGPVVARRFGGARFLSFFFLCGIGAAVAQLVCSWGTFEPVVGASGAISGLMAAGIRMVPLPGARFETEPLLPLASSRVLLFTGIWAVVNVVAGMTGFTGVGTEVRLIAWQAHLGGYFCGLLLSGPFDRISRRDSITVA
ncbi:MAG TPA: rhomboid family intramembrane serine protease [Rhizomicrobium sp.]|jgi:membrane associated rhomboid family serine protease